MHFNHDELLPLFKYLTECAVKTLCDKVKCGKETEYESLIKCLLESDEKKG